MQTARIAQANLETNYSQFWSNPGEKLLLAEKEKAELTNKKSDAEEEFENVFLGYFH